MAQVFPRRSALFVKLVFLGLLAAGIALVFGWKWAMSYPAARGEPVPQPIPFSHKHHVNDDGIDCRYCHTSVEKSSFANVPQTEICMTCHSQIFNDAPVLAPLRESLASGQPIRWNRVHDLPDFVYFDHSIHVNKGVGCVSCHGRVDQMPITWRTEKLEMQWCLGCHRDPLPNLREPGQVFDLRSRVNPDVRAEQALFAHYGIESERRRTDCSTCHR
jgi:hypothetical protein